MGNVLCCSECTDCICCEAVEQFELPPTKTGDLLKQGKYTKHINKRYCIMKDGLLTYYESSDSDGKGLKFRNSVDLRSFQLHDSARIINSNNLDIIFVARSRESQRHQYYIDGLISPSTTYEFTASNGTTKREWIQAIDAHTNYWKDRPMVPKTGP